jgi:photosystem II stability/assembly factor-like uncharacterized protein
MSAVAAHRKRDRLVLRQAPPLWRVANLVCSLALLVAAGGLTVAVARWAHVLAMTPRQTRSLNSFGLGPAVTVDLQLHVVRAAIFFLSLFVLLGVLWVVFAWFGTGRALNEPGTVGTRLFAGFGALLTGCGGLALMGYGFADRIDASASWVAQSGLVTLGAGALAAGSAFAWRLGAKGVPVLLLATMVTVLLGGSAVLADRAAPPTQFALETWPSGSFLAGSADNGQGGSWTTGGFWTGQLVDKGPEATLYFAASCQSNEHCLAFGLAPLDHGVVMASSNGGMTWDAQAIVGPSDSFSIPAPVSCWDADDCVIGGRPPEMSSDGGRSWHALGAAARQFTNIVDCTAPERCLMAGDFPAGKTMLVTDNAGKTWEPGDLPAGKWDVSSLSCTNAASCVAVGSTGGTYLPEAVAVIWRTSDGGLSWRRANIPAKPGTVLSAVACSASGECFANGELDSWAKGVPFTYASSNGGANWAPVATAPQGSLACSLVRCIVVSLGFSTPASWVRKGESQWVSSGLDKVAPVGVSLLGLSCTESGICLAVGDDLASREGVIYYSHDSGVTWANARMTQAPVPHRP